MAKMLGKKLNYHVDDSEELCAIGLTSVLGGFFSVYSVSTALGRTMVNVKSGSQTSLSTVFICALLMAINLWLGPLLRDLPKCVLASIIIVALKSMFMKCGELKRIYAVSKIDFDTGKMNNSSSPSRPDSLYKGGSPHFLIIDCFAMAYCDYLAATAFNEPRFEQHWKRVAFSRKSRRTFVPNTEGCFANRKQKWVNNSLNSLATSSLSLASASLPPTPSSPIVQLSPFPADR